jgi:tetratricopeptide (TPR) repeat protein
LLAPVTLAETRGHFRPKQPGTFSRYGWSLSPKYTANEAVALFCELNAQWYLGWSLHQLGRVAHAQGDEKRASDLFEESLTHLRVAGDRGFATAYQFANLGDVARAQGDYRRATRLYEDALTRLRELGFKQGMVHTLHSLAEVSRAQGANARSVALHHEALLIAAVRTELGENTFDVTWTDAWAMSLGEAVAYALSEPPAN